MTLMTYQEPSTLTCFPLSHTQRVAIEATDSGPETGNLAEGRDFAPDFLSLLCHHGSGEGILEIGFYQFVAIDYTMTAALSRCFCLSNS